MKTKSKPTSPERTGYRALEDVIGCKWSVAVLLAIDEGIARPGALERHIAGISTKVLSERLRKLTDYGLVTRTVELGIPLKTEYRLTAVGSALMDVIGNIRALDERLRREDDPTAGRDD
jgi:DNA-binding HxlR family transcriptional regulator